jgi:nitroimidazol reductase NimA-like FMN-containing flavoprotein (pyridoxamine 5'-phosphate oxidase superfamily)
MNGLGMGEGVGRLKDTSRQEAMRRLASVPLGRVAFTSHALPAMWPANHLVDNGHLIIRSYEGSAIVNAAGAERGAVVAYEADDIDTVSRSGWSVLVVGLARLVDDPDDAARYQKELHSLVPGEIGCVIRIYPELITGFELAGSGGPEPPPAG